jgi:uncharacterized membrane protein
MAKFFSNLYAVLGAGLILLILIALCLHQSAPLPIMVFLHVISGIMWIGHLYYFNFTQIPTMPKIPAELKKGVSGYIAPEALFWFRWGAVATLVTGLIVAYLNHYLHEAMTFQPAHRAIGIGMWLAIIMAINVWFVIWPNQKRALGLVEADDASKAKSASTAMMFSRTNTLLSIPMLFCMVVERWPVAI